MKKNELIKIFIYLYFLVFVCCNSIFADKVGDSLIGSNISDKVKINIATLSKVKKTYKGFVTEPDGTYLYDNDGNLLIDYFYKTNNNDYYYADSKGKIVTNTFVAADYRSNSNFSFDNTTVYYYYFDFDGKAIKNRKRTVGGHQFEFDKNGRIKDDNYETRFLLNKNLDFSNKTIGDVISFGVYNQENNSFYQQLNFDVIDEKDDKLLIVSSNIIDCLDYEEIDYENIRIWLNNNFLYWSFRTDEELDKICISDVIYNGKYYEDKIFLLSDDEIKKYYDEKKLRYKLTRATKYSLRNNMYISKNSDRFSPYYLRNNNSDKLIYLSSGGNIVYDIKNVEIKNIDDGDDDMIDFFDFYEYVNNLENVDCLACDGNLFYSSIGVRPAMWIRKK